MVRAVGKPAVSAHDLQGREAMSQEGRSSSEQDPDTLRGELSPEDREAFKRRAAELGARLEKGEAKSRAKRGGSEPGNRGSSAGLGQAMKMAIELAVGFVVGGFIGKVLDDQLGTAPLLLIVFMMVGFAAGMLNVIRTAQRMQAEQSSTGQSADPARREDEGEK
jgi:ATP synthase protein I